MDLGGLSWGLITIVGAAILAIVIGWAALKNRKAPGGIERTEQATRELYREEDRAHADEGDKAP